MEVEHHGLNVRRFAVFHRLNSSSWVKLAEISQGNRDFSHGGLG